MHNFITKFKLLYQESLLLKAIVFLIGASVMVFAIYGWSLFQKDSFEVKYETYQYVRQTKGSRASPAMIYLSDSNNNLIGVTYLAKDCFDYFDLQKEFELGYVEYNREKIVVACYQEESVLEVLHGLSSVKGLLEFEQLMATTSLVFFLISICGLCVFLFKN